MYDSLEEVSMKLAILANAQVQRREEAKNQVQVPRARPLDLDVRQMASHLGERKAPWQSSDLYAKTAPHRPCHSRDDDCAEE